MQFVTLGTIAGTGQVWGDVFSITGCGGSGATVTMGGFNPGARTSASSIIPTPIAAGSGYSVGTNCTTTDLTTHGATPPTVNIVSLSQGWVQSTLFPLGVQSVTDGSTYYFPCYGTSCYLSTAAQIGNANYISAFSFAGTITGYTNGGTISWTQGAGGCSGTATLTVAGGNVTAVTPVLPETGNCTSTLSLGPLATTGGGGTGLTITASYDATFTSSLIRPYSYISVNVDAAGDVNYPEPFGAQSNSTTWNSTLLRFPNLTTQAVTPLGTGTTDLADWHIIAVTAHVQYSAPVQIFWEAGNYGQSVSPLSPIVLAVKPYPTEYENNVTNTVTAGTNYFNRIASQIDTAASQLAGDGLSVILVNLPDVCVLPNSQNLCDTYDGTHPTAAGHAILALAMENALDNFKLHRNPQQIGTGLSSSSGSGLSTGAVTPATSLANTSSNTITTPCSYYSGAPIPCSATEQLVLGTGSTPHFTWTWGGNISYWNFMGATVGYISGTPTFYFPTAGSGYMALTQGTLPFTVPQSFTALGFTNTQTPVSAIEASLDSTHNVGVNIGVNATTNNYIRWEFNYPGGSGSATNYGCIEFGAGCKFTIYPTGAATFTGEATLPASTTSAASLNVPQGSAPTSPANGDMWTTSAGLYVRINGATVGPLAVAGGCTTCVLVLAQSGTAVSITGDTAAHLLATYTMPGGTMGANGMLEIKSLWSATNNADTKTPTIYLSTAATCGSGTVYYNNSYTSAASFTLDKMIFAANATNAQVGGPSGTTTSWGISGGAVITSAIDTTATTYINICGALGASGDTMTLLGYSITYAPHS